MQKSNDRVKAYQQIPGLTDGMREIEGRTGLFVPSDFAGATVLDMGCNVGQMCFWAKEQGARAVTGVDFDLSAFKLARSYREQLGISSSEVRFKLDDLDLPTAWHNLSAHDTVLFLSVIDTKELKNRFGMLARACMKTKRALYLEGHLKQPTVRYTKLLLDYTDFTSIVCLGSQEGRDLYRCTRDVLDRDGFQRELLRASTRYRRICVIGNQLAGKTTLKRSLDGLPPQWKVLDDCNNLQVLGAADPLLLFDYRGALYCDDFDVIFNVLQPGEKFETKRASLEFLQSSKLKDPTRLAEFHTVLTHGSIETPSRHGAPHRDLT
jgi:hypothetical protein